MVEGDSTKEVGRTSGEVLELAENGLFLGPFRNVSYANARAPFDPGDRLLLYTDELAVEATDNGLLASELAAGIARVKSAERVQDDVVDIEFRHGLPR